MAELLDLDPDQLLSTTRAVRKRLDLDRPVEPEVIRQCIEVAGQAPTASNSQGWHFVVVTDPAQRRALAELYREGFDLFYGDPEAALAGMPQDDPDYLTTQRRVIDSARYLADHLAEVPVHLIPCVEGRLRGGSGGAPRRHLGVAAARGVELLPGRPGPGTGHVLDHAAPDQGARGGRAAGPARQRSCRAR